MGARPGADRPKVIPAAFDRASETVLDEIGKATREKGVYFVNHGAHGACEM